MEGAGGPVITMQTFLPYPSFTLSAICLDNKRLNKQILECDQILNALAPGSTSGWRNHPAVKMWRGYEPALIQYQNACMYEWKRRGFNRANLLRKDPSLPYFWPSKELAA